MEWNIRGSRKKVVANISQMSTTTFLSGYKDNLHVLIYGEDLTSWD